MRTICDHQIEVEQPEFGQQFIDPPFAAPLPPPRERHQWQHAAEMACAYWRRVAEDGVVSVGFRKIARAGRERT